MTAETATPPTPDGAHKKAERPDEDQIWALHNEGVCLAQTGKPDLAAEAYLKLITLTPDDLHARHNLGIMLVLSGKGEEAIHHLETAHEMAPEDGQIRAHLVNAYFGVATHHMMECNFDKARSGFHRLFAFDPNHVPGRTNLLELMSRTKGAATMADFAPELGGRPIGTHVLVAGMPESGSNDVAAALSALTGWEQNFLAFGYRQNEQELYLPHLLAVAAKNTVTGQHFRATDTNIQIIQAFGIKPVVVVRNLYDIVVGLAESYDRGTIQNTFFASHWEHLEPARRLDLIIDHMVPWHLTFFVSWIAAAEADRVDCMLVDHEAWIANKTGVLMGICDYQGIKASIESCEAAAAQTDGMDLQTGMNKGDDGRSKDALSEAQKERIGQLAAYFHDVDFSPIGL
jgi:hypothetical protein